MSHPPFFRMGGESNSRSVFVGKEASMLKSWFKYFDTNMNGIIEKQEFVERHLAHWKFFWIYPAPRIPVTTRMTVHILGNPNLNLYLQGLHPELEG